MNTIPTIKVIPVQRGRALVWTTAMPKAKPATTIKTPWKVIHGPSCSTSRSQLLVVVARAYTTVPVKKTNVDA